MAGHVTRYWPNMPGIFTCTCNIDMKVVHIAGKKNSIADLLSRWFTVANNVQNLQQLVHPVTWIHTSQDLLATHDGI